MLYIANYVLQDIAAGSRVDGDVVNGYGEEYAQVLLQEGLGRLDKRSQDLASDLKLAAWKVILASWTKLQCGVGNRWFSEYLHMGSIYSISKAVSAELSQGSRRKRMWRKLGTPKSKA